jgi:hypothetical protein
MTDYAFGISVFKFFVVDQNVVGGVILKDFKHFHVTVLTVCGWEEFSELNDAAYQCAGITFRWASIERPLFTFFWI